MRPHRIRSKGVSRLRNLLSASALAAGLVVVPAGAAMVASAGTAMASSDGGYPWASAPCSWTGDTSPTKCVNPADPNNVNDWYDWGEQTLPSGDSYTTKVNGYYQYDQWGYQFRNCTSFVAWKISQEFPGTSTAGWGQAYQWSSNAPSSKVHPASGYTPQVGDIAVWGTEVGADGHVAYVASVSNGVATFDEYNVAETGIYTDAYTSTNHPGAQASPDYYIHLGTPLDGGGGDSGTGYQIAFQAAGSGDLYLKGTTAGGSTGLGVAGGTSPSITALSAGSYEVAFQAAGSHDLWTYGAIGTFDTGQGMMAGTNPSITALPSDGYEIALQANTGYLTVNGTAGTFNTGQGMATGTSPSIISWSSGAYRVAFHAANGDLWIWDSSTGATDTGLGMASGTSPSMTAMPSGGYQIAFQAAGSGDLYLAGSAANGSTGLGMAGGTNPSIAQLKSGGYEVAFQAAGSDDLWVYGNAGTGNQGLGVASGSSPTITGLSGGGYQIAFQAAGSGDLYLKGTTAGGITSLGMASGTSPAICSQ